MPDARDPIFDLAVNRALSYAQKLGVELHDTAKLRMGLELWYLKTRFAYRVPLEGVVRSLTSYPGAGRWRGGTNGGWVSEGSAER